MKEKTFVLLVGATVLAVVLVVGTYLIGAAALSQRRASPSPRKTETAPVAVLPARWGSLGKQMIAAGVIDPQKFEALYRNNLPVEIKKLLYEEGNGDLELTQENSGVILNLLWALGLGTKNSALAAGPMADPRYGNTGNFASTGGWTLAQGEAMDHYGRHPFVVLTPEQEALVARVAKNIYRPCCNNDTHFPDCNHGMAMLGLLQLMTSQGADEQKMYAAALEANVLWFPRQYATVARYLESQGRSWADVAPREILGAEYSSASGFARVASLVPPEPQRQGGGSCGV